MLSSNMKMWVLPIGSSISRYNSVVREWQGFVTTRMAVYTEKDLQRDQGADHYLVELPRSARPYTHLSIAAESLSPYVRTK